MKYDMKAVCFSIIQLYLYCKENEEVGGSYMSFSISLMTSSNSLYVSGQMTCQVTSSTHGAKTRTNVAVKHGRYYLKHNTMDKVTSSFMLFLDDLRIHVNMIISWIQVQTPVLDFKRRDFQSDLWLLYDFEYLLVNKVSF